MKVTIVNKWDILGGAARGAFRHHTALKKIGVDSRMLVDKKISDYLDVYGPTGKISKAWRKLRPEIDKFPLNLYNHQETPFHTAWVGRNISKEKLIKETDIINLRWVTRGFLSIKDISKLYKLNKPIVWTLPDMWPFTGGCHLSGDCERYIDSCGACPQLKSTKNKDITRWVWKKKRKAYKDLNLTIVTPSRWLSECAKKSSLLTKFSIEVIPNGLNTDIFKPINKAIARYIFNIPKNKKIILFGAIAATSDRNKGFKYLREAIINLSEMKGINCEEYHLVVFGASSSKNIEKLPFSVEFLGNLADDYSLALSYSAADVFVGPSLQEAFGLTYLEAMSCGTPCVAFDYSGPKDIIDHELNGYLAEYKNSQSLAEGINWILEDENRLHELGESAREKALQEYSLEVQAKRYVKLYEKLLEKNG